MRLGEGRRTTALCHASRTVAGSCCDSGPRIGIWLLLRLLNPRATLAELGLEISLCDLNAFLGADGASGHEQIDMKRQLISDDVKAGQSRAR